MKISRLLKWFTTDHPVTGYSPRFHLFATLFFAALAALIAVALHSLTH